MGTLFRKTEIIVVDDNSDLTDVAAEYNGQLLLQTTTGVLYKATITDGVTAWTAAFAAETLASITPLLKAITGYNAGSTQFLKNVTGTLTWSA